MYTVYRNKEKQLWLYDEQSNDWFFIEDLNFRSLKSYQGSFNDMCMISGSPLKYIDIEKLSAKEQKFITNINWTICAIAITSFKKEIFALKLYATDTIEYFYQKYFKVRVDLERISVKAETIKNAISEHIHLPYVIWGEKGRKRDKVYCRQLFYHLCKRFTPLTLSDISKELPLLPNHATVMYGNTHIYDLMDTDKKVMTDVEEIRKIIYTKHKETDGRV